MAGGVNVIIFMFFLLMDVAFEQAGAGLDPNFYSRTCPNVAQIVATSVNRHLKQDVSIAAPLVRMFFHDCFVEGCDASVLLVSPTKTAERDAVPNLTLSQFHLIDEIKSNLEKACAATVSCADILALAARDAVLQTGGPTWPVELGRRDGMKSTDSDAANHLPSSRSDAQTLINSFTSNGLSLRDLVTLSGAHTFGRSHCSTIAWRLYGFGSINGRIDPTLNKTYAMNIRKQCPSPINPSTTVSLDPSTPNRFDSTYFQILLQNQGILGSDSALVLDPRTKIFVSQYASNEASFRYEFGNAMIKMGRIGVRTGQQDQIRKRCGFVNT